MIKDNEVSYWDQYYKKGVAPEDPSAFAEYVQKKYVNRAMSLIELGCGNGRDAVYFATKGIRVHAIDQIVSEINDLKLKYEKIDNLLFGAGDFTKLPLTEEPYDVIYSRFTLHSVDKSGQDRVLKWSAKSLAPGGYLLIETRGQKNEIFEKGKKIAGEIDAYVFEDHYRRFVEFNQFVEDIKNSGFEIVESNERKGYAPYRNTDYHFIRIIAKKQ
jgi:tellurite methyltransferase